MPAPNFFIRQFLTSLTAYKASMCIMWVQLKALYICKKKFKKCDKHINFVLNVGNLGRVPSFCPILFWGFSNEIFLFHHCGRRIVHNLLFKCFYFPTQRTNLKFGYYKKLQRFFSLGKL